MQLLQDAVGFVHQAGPWLPAWLALAALIEYVFPPFPGDTITLVGAAVAVQGQWPVWQLFAALMAGALAGSAIDYAAGVWLARRLELGHGTGLVARWLPPERMARIEAQYRRHGPWLIAANRFLPVSRSMFFVFAGLTRIGLGRTLLYGSISAVAWNALLIGIAYAVDANLDRLTDWFEQFNRGALVVTIVLVAIALVLWFWSKKRSRP